MAEMKDSGIEWIGEIPDDWKIFHFKYIVKEKIDNRGRTPEIDENDIGIPIIELDAIGNKNPDVEKASKFISEESYKKYIRKGLKSGDVLFGTVGSVGKCSIVPNEFNYCIAQNIVGYRFNNEQDSLFWYYYFKSEPFKHMYMQFNKGNIQNSIKISDMERGVLVIPPLKQQQFIANFLDKKCAEIDSLYTDIEKQIETLEEYKKSIITEAVTKGLDPDVEMKDSGIEWIGKIPKDWEIRKGKYTLRYLQKEVKEDDGVITCFRDGEVTLRSNRREDGFTMSDKEIGYQGIDIGDLVVHGMDGFAGAIGISDSRGKASPVLNVLDTDENKKYYMYSLRSMAYSNVFLATATGIRVRSCDLRWVKIAELPFPMPSRKEQDEIVSYIDRICNGANEIIADKKKQLETLEQYKKSVIYEYVTGKKEVQ